MAAIFIIDLVPRNRLVAFGACAVTTCLVVEAALVANYPVGPGQNDNALRAAVAMTFLYIVSHPHPVPGCELHFSRAGHSRTSCPKAFAQLFLDGTQYVYYAELFPQHLRGKGMTIGMGAISLMNVMWLMSAPTAFEKIGWKFYLCFIIPAYLFAIVCLLFYPNTKGLALEEIAALFGDEVESVTLDAVYDSRAVRAAGKNEEVSDTGSVPDHVEVI